MIACFLDINATTKVTLKSFMCIALLFVDLLIPLALKFDDDNVHLID